MVVRATTSTTAIAPFNILDVYTGSAAAYSLRKLRGAYSGAAVRVRRSNDNAEQDIGFDALGNFDELSLVSFVGVNSGFVTTWYDQSGNVRNATQAIAANQPRIVDAGVVDKVNGRSSLTYPSNTMQFIYSGTGLSSTNAWFFNVFSTTDQIGLWHYSSAGTFLGAWGQTEESTTSLDMGNVVTRVNGGIISPLTRLSLRNAVATGSLLVASHGQVITNPFLDPKYNGYDNASLGGYSVTGSSPEFILYTSDQSSNRATIEANIMSYYGIN
jgi:hypothetical protein